jgi:hypothetical protein
MGAITGSLPKYKLAFNSDIINSPKTGQEVRKTEVLIYREDDKEMTIDTAIAYGRAIQNVCDQDCRFRGQKAALRKAIESKWVRMQDIEDRTLIWRIFLMRSKKGRAILDAIENKN